MKIETYLQDHGVGYEKHLHSRTYTAQGLAHTEHVSGYMVAKPVIVKGDSGYTMCVLPAPRHLDLNRAAQVLNEEVRLATESEMATLFPDCDLGAEPPVGSLFDMPTVMDARLKEDDHLVMQSGSHTEAIKVRRADWERLCNPIVATISGT